MCLTRIAQCRVSRVLRFFEQRFMSKYDFAPYTNPKEPAVFFGCYRRGSGVADLPTVLKHRGLAIVVFSGSDATQLGDNARKLKAPNIRLVAISAFIARDLDKLGLSYTKFPVCPSTTGEVNPVPLGHDIYAYSAHGNPTFYGEPVVRRLEKRLPQFRFRVCYAEPPDCVPHEQMPRVYAKCFMGLRLVPHDGLPNTVVELGLMGRRCVWNGDLPNALHYTDEDSIVQLILKESARIGTVQHDVAASVRKALDIGDGWTYVNAWE